MNPLSTAHALRELRERYGDLHAARMPGTPRPWSEQSPTAEQRERRDCLVAQERQERTLLTRQGLEPPGSSPAPARVDVLDAISTVTWGVAELEDAVRDRLGYSRTCGRCRHEALSHDPGPCTVPGCWCLTYRIERRPRAVASGAVDQTKDVGDTIGDGDRRRDSSPHGSAHWVACVWLEDQLPVVETAPELAEHLAEEVNRLHGVMLAALDEVEDGTMIKAPCIACEGVTDERSNGGAWTLRLHTASRVMDAHVVCTNPACDPPEALCGSKLRGRPMWPAPELEWLAARLEDRAQHVRRKSA